MTSKQKFFLGVDGGGTKTKVRLEDKRGNLLAEANAGSANISYSVDNSTTAIMQATKLALKQAGLTQQHLGNTYAGLGLAGANLEHCKNKFLRWQHPFAKLFVTSDLHIACLGAHAGKDGAVIICGTGFNAGANINNHYFEMGGYGLILGDTASGSSMGLRAVRLTLQVLDGVKPHCLLADKVKQMYNCSSADELFQKTSTAKPDYFAQLAPEIFAIANKDQYALNIIQHAADSLTSYIKRLQAFSAERLCVIGGLAKPLKNYLHQDLQKTFSPVIYSPEQGAIIYLKQQLANN